MKSAMAAVDGRADGKRVSGLVRSGARGMRTQIELPNEVAAELAGSQDAVLRAWRSTCAARCSCAATCSRSTVLSRTRARASGSCTSSPS